MVTDGQAQALLREPPDLAVHVVRTAHWLASGTPQVQHALWTLGDSHYPQALLQLADPPLMLFAQGQVEGQLGHAVAVVGSRNPTPQGAQTAEQFGQALQSVGLCVVSGLALGVDGAAHRGALAGVDPTAHSPEAQRAPWRTVAVVGTGLDRAYPRQHHALAQAIALHGLLLSEYPLGTPPLAANFPKRNRIIAALGLGTLVVEAALKSGSLITARMALDLGREVLAVPGSIHSPQSHGCHALIRQGAKLVETVQDVVDELQLTPQHTPDWLDSSAASSVGSPPADGPEATLLTHLGYTAVSLDALIARSGLDAASLQAQLLSLELEGRLARLPGGLFQRLA